MELAKALGMGEMYRQMWDVLSFQDFLNNAIWRLVCVQFYIQGLYY
jgi:hypothetical protein